jgi:hypothetical protein
MVETESSAGGITSPTDVFNSSINTKEEIHKFTKSSDFIRHLLGYSLSFWGTDYYNCYIEPDERCMYLVFRKPFDNINKINNITEELIVHTDFISYISNENWLIFKLHIPVKFEKDFNFFLSGSYSKVSEDFKQTILSLFFRYNRGSYDTFKKIFYPSNEHIDRLERYLDCKLPVREVYDIPDLDEERFNSLKFT